MSDLPDEPSGAGPPPIQTSSKAGPRRRWVRLMGIPVFSYLGVIGMMMALENSLIFFPSIYPEGTWNPPGLSFEDAWFEASDGTKLHGWYAPNAKPRAVVLLAHGNAGNLSHRAEMVEALVKRLGVSVLIFDYRGYGKSGGTPSEAGILADARTARRWLAQRAKASSRPWVIHTSSGLNSAMVPVSSSQSA